MRAMTKNQTNKDVDGSTRSDASFCRVTMAGSFETNIPPKKTEVKKVKYDGDDLNASVRYAKSAKSRGRKSLEDGEKKAKKKKRSSSRGGLKKKRDSSLGHVGKTRERGQKSSRKKKKKESKSSRKSSKRKASNASDEKAFQALSDIQCAENTLKVSFSTLEIREYPICIGDNPACTFGVPISIDWAYETTNIFSVDEYEEQRPTPRDFSQLKIPSKDRNHIIRGIGYSLRDVMEGTKHANIARNRRKRTKETLHLAPVEEFLELSVRAILNATFRRGAKTKERELLAAYRHVSKADKTERSSDMTVTVEASVLAIQESEHTFSRPPSLL